MYLHIGLGRAGSTYLQKKIFPYFQGIKFLSSVNSKTFNKERINFFYNPTFISKKKYSGKKLLISTENFFHSKTSLVKLINEIKLFSKKPKLILILRNPKDHLISTYKHIVKTGDIWLRIEDHFNFNDTNRSQLIRPNIIFDKSLYEYDKLILELKKNFDLEIFVFEKIFKNYFSMKDFIEQLSEIFNTKFSKKFKKSDFNSINKSLTSKIMIKQKRIKNFKKNNKKLYKKIDLNLDYFEEICSNKFLNRFEKEIRDKNNIYFSKLNV
tara:strand:- start:263 stop:1066 length:804 start_codon:yes stop_codon:yes gene_type:complete